jgi:soluble lytic murein transglycosylase-like protein
MRAVMKTESDFDPNVISSAGARGLMQLMPHTARLMGVTDIFDPRQNVMGGARYLQVLARRFCKTPADTGQELAADRSFVCSDEEKVKVIAGYHAGPGAVLKYGGMPPYETTRAYVTMVMRRYDQYRQAAGAGAFVASGEGGAGASSAAVAAGAGAGR